MKNIYIFLFIILSISVNIFAQTDKEELQRYKFVLSDSSKIIGTIVFEDENVIQIKKERGGEIRINKRHIVSKEVLPELKTEKEILPPTEEPRPEESYEDPSVCRLFLTPTARGLKAGEGYIALNEIVMPNVAIGLTDWLSASGYFFILPIEQAYLFCTLQGKVYENDFSSIAVGGLARIDLISPRNDYALFGLYSLYNSNLMLNIGAGINPATKFAIFSIGGEIDLNGKQKLLTDNWFSSNGDFVFSFGGKSYGKNFAVSLGVLTLFAKDKDSFTSETSFKYEGFAPWVGFEYHF